MELDTWEHQEEIRLSQLAKKKWFKDSDQNSKFFHAIVNQRRKSNTISHMELEDESKLSDHEQVHLGAVSYFQNFLSQHHEVEALDLSSLIETRISKDDNSFLCRHPSEDEVLAALRSSPRNSSLGPDGFGSAFYLSYWEIVKEDVVAAAKDFFTGTSLPRFYSSSFIVLIPKVVEPKIFDKFRPISLCSVAYKKILKF